MIKKRKRKKKKRNPYALIALMRKAWKQQNKKRDKNRKSCRGRQGVEQ